MIKTMEADTKPNSIWYVRSNAGKGLFTSKTQKKSVCACVEGKEVSDRRVPNIVGAKTAGHWMGDGSPTLEPTQPLSPEHLTWMGDGSSTRSDRVRAM